MHTAQRTNPIQYIKLQEKVTIRTAEEADFAQPLNEQPTGRLRRQGRSGIRMPVPAYS